MHAIAFHDWGYHVVGTDLSEEMVAKSVENAGKREIGFLQLGFQDLATVQGRFDAVTCLGNSLPHVLTDEDLDLSLSSMFDVLLPGGVLIIHNHNYDRIMQLKARFMPPTSARKDGEEHLFLRFFDFEDDLLNFNMLSLKKRNGQWEMFPDSTKQRPLTKRLLEEHLEKSGFVNIRFMSFPGGAFHELESDNMVAVAERPHTIVSNPVNEPVKAIDRIPIEENNEPLVDLETFAPNILRAGKKILMRKHVAEMLLAAHRLLPDGMNFKVQIAFRSLAYQRELYSAYHDQLVEAHPNWPPSQVKRELNRLVAPPDAGHPPGHTTGGAVDLSIVGPDGAELDMMSPIDPNTEETKLYPTYSRMITPASAKNREILISTMTAAGFSNYAGEWWHYSYGDNAWALRLGKPTAIYGAAPEEEGEGIVFDSSLPIWEA